MKKEIVKNIFSDQKDTDIALTSENNSPLLFKDLKDLANKISRQLSGNQISNKDRAAIILPNGPYMASSFLAISSYMSAAPLNPNYKSDEYEFYLNDLKPKIVLVEPNSTNSAVVVAKKLKIPICEIKIKKDQPTGFFDLFNKENNFNEDSIGDIVKNSFNKNAPVFNNVSQHLNHMHFWEIMKNNPDGKIPSELENKINEDFGSVENMKEAFINAGIGQFGSGWCWLVLNNGKLEITKTPNAENPIVHGHSPLLGCDVWEHSYYVDYKNRRPDYLKAFVDNLVNWEKVTEEFSKNL